MNDALHTDKSLTHLVRSLVARHTAYMSSSGQAEHHFMSSLTHKLTFMIIFLCLMMMKRKF